MPRMGDLAATDVYSAFDVPLEQTYDRRLDETWPGRLAQEAIGAVLAPGRALQSVVPITTEEMIKPAADLAGLVTGGSYAAPAQKGASGAGIRAYHSSPHDFDKFDLSKIGTGEGAQVYGHGLYFAESPAVSGQGGQYWQQFTRKFEGPEYLAADKLKKSGFDRDVATASAQWEVRELEDQLKRGVPPPGLQGGPFDEHILRSITKNMLYEKQAELDLLRSNRPVGPRTYEVEIKADPARFMQWDQPLPERGALSESIDKIYRDAFQARRLPADTPSKYGFTGNRIYKDLADVVPGKARASETLLEGGIPGIKYLDQGSRAAGTGSSNYVVFDPGIIDIMKKYGIAGAAPVGMGALAAQDRYE